MKYLRSYELRLTNAELQCVSLLVSWLLLSISCKIGELYQFPDWLSWVCTFIERIECSLSKHLVKCMDECPLILAAFRKEDHIVACKDGFRCAS